MNRKDEILNFANKLMLESGHGGLVSYLRAGFIQGAEWADQNPAKDYCSVNICDGGIWECKKDDLESQLAQCKTKLEVAEKYFEELYIPYSARGPVGKMPRFPDVIIIEALEKLRAGKEREK